MKITKQIDDSHFEVEMQESDKLHEIEVSVVHDYVSISAPSPFCTNLEIKGEYAPGAINCLSHYANIQIPIRAAQTILKLVKDHEYLKQEHLLKNDGKANYLWNNLPIKFKNEKGKWCVAVRGDDEEEYSIISLKAYNKLTGIKDKL